MGGGGGGEVGARGRVTLSKCLSPFSGFSKRK